MFLTEEEIRELTNRKQRSAQVMVLNALGITHKVRPDSSLVVLRVHVEHELGYRTPPPKKEKDFEPNWAFLRLEAEDAERRKLQQKAKRERGQQERKKRD